MSRETPLKRLHHELGAECQYYADWWMPMCYKGAVHEHLAVRESAGFFDVSHMGRYFITSDDLTSKDPERYLQHLTTNNVNKLNHGDSQYSFLTHPNGGTVDDIYVYRPEPWRYLLVVNAANSEKVYAHLQEHLEALKHTRLKINDVKIQDVTESYSMVSVQGPRSPEVMRHVLEEDFRGMKRNDIVSSSFSGRKLYVARTGYTGEKWGYEIFVPAENAESFCKEILHEKVEPVGLSGRNMLRTQAGLPLYGCEHSEEIGPVGAGLWDWAVDFGKGPFIGREALLEQKDSEMSIRRFKVLEGSTPFRGKIGEGHVTSAARVPYRSGDLVKHKVVGMAYLPKSMGIGEEFDISLKKGRTSRGKIVKRFIKHSGDFVKVLK